MNQNDLNVKQTKRYKFLTCTMSLSANFPREEILMSSPSSSTIATKKRYFMKNKFTGGKIVMSGVKPDKFNETKYP